MRGKVLPLLHSPHPPGITPACAGKRLRIGVRYAQRKDHPRVCGEKRQGNMNKEVKVGSPPRMRGKASHHEVCVLVLGITPAYAGKSSTATLAAHSTGDHPRVCGEKSANPKVRDTMEGASPRMRGKVFFFTGASFCAIFFLEPSGNLLLEPSGSSWVPPDGSIFVFAIGLPPRVRGKAITFREQDSADGITPAYAGKSDATRWTITIRRDHPRVCGEKTLCRSTVVPVWGSPPRVRGKAVPLRSAAASGCRGPSVPEYDAPP